MGNRYFSSTFDFRKPLVKCACPCGNTFTRKQWQIKRGHGPTYCSNKCARIYRVLPIEARFWSHVNKNGPTIRPKLGPCWIWTGGCDSNGYGAIKTTKRTLTHRVSWELHFGPIPNGLCVLHKCDNPPCVNPGHLFLGTKKDNTQDMVQKGRWKQGRAILKEFQVIEIRAAGRGTYADYQRRARSYGVTVSAIKDIVYNRRWVHVK